MKKLGLICLILVIAIGGTGLAYAGWSQTLTISGSVATGFYDVEFVSFSAPAGSSGAVFSATPVDTHSYTITCQNLYPGLQESFDFVIKNSGTVPGQVSDVKINNSSITFSGYQIDLELLQPDDETKDITVMITGIPAGTALNPGESVTGNLTVYTWQLGDKPNDATPQAQGSFTLEIETLQQY